jgi:hypothetical protein
VADGLELTWSPADGRDLLRIEGWSDEELARIRGATGASLAQDLPVFPTDLVEASAPDVPPAVHSHRLTPMPGEYRADEAGVTFTPRHAFLRGRSYTVLVDDERRFTITLGGPVGPPTTSVVAVWPSTRSVPRNLLRCYLTFSGPMSEGEAESRIRVVDAASGRELAGALLAMEPELWDADRTRLTVLFDPARIKRGLAPHRQEGYPLREGATIDLVVDREMRDARGLPLVAKSRSRFAVGADVRSRVDPARWAIGAVRAGTRDRLDVDFPGPLDRALLAHCLAVLDGRGERVAGTAEVAPGEAGWTFHPDLPWSAGGHALVVDPMLEDVCGNSVARVFDRELADPAHEPLTDRSRPLPIRFVVADRA